MDNLLGRRDLLSRVIKQREQSLEKMKNEFNQLQRESNRLQFTVEKLAIQNMEDKKKLSELEKEISEIPTLSRSKSNPVWKDYAKAITVILLFLLPVLSKAQDEPTSFGIFGKTKEGKQGFLYGGGISYYPVQTRLKIQVGITNINKFISVGYYRNL